MMDYQDKTANPLGKSTTYSSHYDPGLLYPIARQDTRAHLHLTDGSLPFRGEDIWTAYEISWLDTSGKPQVRLAECMFDCDIPFIIESKSFKLYLNSFNQTRFDDESLVIKQIEKDLSLVTQGEVKIRFYPLSSQALSIKPLPGRCIDDIDITIEDYTPSSRLLSCDKQQPVSDEILFSHLLKSNCPVTNQPDWATIFIEYSGYRIVESSLLAYLISFRDHQDFHENCVERIFCDINNQCQPDALSVYARYTRRGGLDINPFRTNYPKGKSQLSGLTLRTCRQ